MAIADGQGFRGQGCLQKCLQTEVYHQEAALGGQ
jgi:hypothetical protein